MTDIYLEIIIRRRLLTIETVFDVIGVVLWLVLFIVPLIEVGNSCAGLNSSCTNFNWLMVWVCLMSLSWLASRKWLVHVNL